MSKGYTTGARSTFTDQADHIVQVEDGIKFLNPRSNGIKFVKKLLANRGGEVAKSYKYNWDETLIPINRETVTLADGSGTTLTVANAYAYQVGDLLKIESEVVRVTAIASSTTLTIVRGYAGTTGAAHSSKVALNLGTAVAENSTGVASLSTNSERLYNYVQQFESAVELSDMEIAELSSEMGNPLNKQLERVTLAFWKRFANSVFYGVRYEDTSNGFHTMGGVNQFLSTNATSVGGALTIAGIDAEILQIVQAGGEPDTIVVSPYQKQKLDALDSSLVRTGKRDTVGGNPQTMTWQSGILDYTLDVVVDHTILDSELYILDTSKMSIIPLSNNGVDGRLSVVDATQPGQSGKKKLLRGYYTFKLETETGVSKLYGLS